MIERFERRLSGWKSKYLSKGGRLTLVKSVLSSIPIYFLSFSFTSLGGEQVGILESIQRKFLWGFFGSDFKYHLVKWNIIKNPLTVGGLGVRDLRLFNVALLGK